MATVQRSRNRFGELFEALSLSVEAGRHLHSRLYAELRQAIVEGRVEPRSRLPSSRDFAQRLGISRNTVNTALNQLAAEGLVTSREGAGTFVADIAAAPDKGPRRVPDRPREREESVFPARRAKSLADVRATLDGLRHRYESSPKPFRIGIPAIDDFPMAPWRKAVAHAQRRLPVHALGDGDPAGLPRLRRAVMSYLRSSRGLRGEPEQLIITAGSQQALDLVARVTADPGDGVLMEDPGYFGATGCFRGSGLRVRGLPVDGDGLLLTASVRRLRPRLIYCTPSSQMPLGVPMAHARRQALLAFASEVGAWIIEDDYDSEYRYDARPLPPLFDLDPAGRVIYMGTFSKTMFPGLRIGFVLLPPALVEAVTALKFLTTWNPPSLEQYALAEFIERGDFVRHVRRSRSLYKERAEALFEAGERWLPPTHRVIRPRSGLSTILTAPAGEDHPQRIAHAEARGLELSPQSMFAVERPASPGYVLGFAAFDADTLWTAVRRLAESF